MMLRRLAARGASRAAFTNSRVLSAVPRTSFSTTPTIAPGSADEFRTQDGLMELASVTEDVDQRPFYYGALTAQRIGIACLGRAAVVKVVSSLSASADVLALASLEVDISPIAVGDCVTVKWRGKPVFIRHRTEGEISTAIADDSADLRDMQTDAERNKDPAWMVVLGICTHLGCVPLNGAGEYGGWYCPCHGSHYDVSGRIRKGPAPLNLEVPEYSINGSILKLG